VINKLSHCSVKILIPLYKEIPNSHEIVSLNRCFEILSRHDISFFTFCELDLTFYKRFNFASIHFFDKTYFQSINGYNVLLLSKSFYEQFLNYEYILIYQLDSYVFYDALEYWCQKKYDYIGSPWMHDYSNLGLKDYAFCIFTFLKRIMREFAIPLNANNKVGNGGFSLRKTSKFHYVLENIDKKILRNYLKYNIDIRYNEDVFWSLEIERFKQLKLVKPTFDEALMFSIDGNPNKILPYLPAMPFGCHGWSKPNQIVNWLKFIKLQ